MLALDRGKCERRQLHANEDQCKSLSNDSCVVMGHPIMPTGSGGAASKKILVGVLCTKSHSSTTTATMCWQNTTGLKTINGDAGLFRCLLSAFSPWSTVPRGREKFLSGGGGVDPPPSIRLLEPWPFPTHQQGPSGVRGALLGVKKYHRGGGDVPKSRSGLFTARSGFLSPNMPSVMGAPFPNLPPFSGDRTPPPHRPQQNVSRAQYFCSSAQLLLAPWVYLCASITWTVLC